MTEASGVDKDPALLGIGEVAAATGLRPSALRYYEDVGLISPAARIGGQRHYDPSVLRRLAVTALCQEAGFTVSDIRLLLGSGRRAHARWQKLAERKLEEVKVHIERANATKRLLEQVLACGCGDPGGCELTHDAAARRLLQIQSRAPATPEQRRGT